MAVQWSEYARDKSSQRHNFGHQSSTETFEYLHLKGPLPLLPRKYGSAHGENAQHIMNGMICPSVLFLRHTSDMVDAIWLFTRLLALRFEGEHLGAVNHEKWLRATLTMGDAHLLLRTLTCHHWESQPSSIGHCVSQLIVAVYDVGSLVSHASWVLDYALEW